MGQSELIAKIWLHYPDYYVGFAVFLLCVKNTRRHNLLLCFLFELINMIFQSNPQGGQPTYGFVCKIQVKKIRMQKK